MQNIKGLKYKAVTRSIFIHTFPLPPPSNPILPFDLYQERMESLHGTQGVAESLKSSLQSCLCIWIFWRALSLDHSNVTELDVQ